ncbi:MAG: hypothetical protein P9L98_02505, partial [Candidatus Kaelpia imicola]|nr:hypothetical protein [Candidatus Kaelpia imicola]
LGTFLSGLLPASGPERSVDTVVALGAAATEPISDSIMTSGDLDVNGHFGRSGADYSDDTMSTESLAVNTPSASPKPLPVSIPAVATDQLLGSYGNTTIGVDSIANNPLVASLKVAGNIDGYSSNLYFGVIGVNLDIKKINAFDNIYSMGSIDGRAVLAAVDLIIKNNYPEDSKQVTELYAFFDSTQNNSINTSYVLSGNLNFFNVYSTLNIQNSISNFINFLLGDIKESTRLVDTELDVNNKITFDSPGAIIKDILEKLNPKKTEETAKLRLAMPKKIRLSHFVMLFFSLLIFSCSLGYSAGMYHIKSRKI